MLGVAAGMTNREKNFCYMVMPVPAGRTAKVKPPVK